MEIRTFLDRIEDDPEREEAALAEAEALLVDLKQ